MSAYSNFELTLREILRVIIPLDEDWSARFQIINDLREVVESVGSLRDATVEPYGSFVSDLFSRWGDLDISIEIPNGSYILSAARKHKQTLLEDLVKVLRNRDGWRRLKFITNARIPILKCENSYTNISCYISINNLSCQMKSKMLFWLKEIDGRFRQMVLLVKEWAKAHNINDPKSGSFNSYCLTLLVIFHLQTCIPAILPPFREIYPGNMIDDLRGVRSVAERHIEETCTANINKFNRLKKQNPIHLCELYVSFLAKFSNVSSWAPTQGICLFTGQWENIDSNTTWQPKTYSLFVEDPFEQPANTARTVKSWELVRISDAFQMTLRQFNIRNQITGSIVPFLVNPETSYLLPKMVYDPSNAYNGRAQTQMNRPKHGPPQARPQASHQAQNGKNVQVDNRAPANVNNQRPVQVWAPAKANTQRPVQERALANASNHRQVQEWAPAKADTQRSVQERAPAKANPERPAQEWVPAKAKTLSPTQEQAPAEDKTQRPAQVSQNQEKQVWVPRSNGKKSSVGLGS